MDMKKAFDMVKHSILFEKLKNRKFPPIFLRLLIVMYKSQITKVKWEGTMSKSFEIKNGVKQGAVLSAILFCVYIDDLLKELRRKRDGCWMNKDFVGVIVYADDIVLLSPSIDGLQNMIDTCSRYAESHNLSFSTHVEPKRSKTKCMAFQRVKTKMNCLMLGGKELPWVNSVTYLGTTITDDPDCRMDQDILEKRAIYISRNNELMQEFYFANSKTKIWTNDVHNTCFHGSPLWDMSSRNFTMLEKTWNVSQRIMLSIPRASHRYLIEPLSKRPHIIKSLRQRFINFITKIKNSDKKVLRNVLEMIKGDCRSTTGLNIRLLKLLAGDINIEKIKVYKEPYKEIPYGSIWRLGMIEEILAIRSGEKMLDNYTQKDLDDILEVVCTS